MTELTVAEFIEKFPEFDTADVPLVQGKLAEAHRAFDEDLFGNLYLDAVGYKCAELLAFSPYGKNTRLSEKSAETTYSLALADICAKVPARFLGF